eukprot:15357300-Ditylum_brightwellii.AAC.1
MMPPHLDHLKIEEDCNSSIRHDLSLKDQEQNLNFSNFQQYLTDHKEEHIIRVCQKLGSFGFPVTRKGLLIIVNRIINKKLNNVNIDEDHPVGIKVVDKLMCRNSDLEDLMDAYTKVLVSMGVIEPHVQSFGYIEASRKYNADEMKNGRRDFKKGMQPPTYMKTPEGDKKMNKHVSLMICSRAD